MAQRARIVLLAAQGKQNAEIAERISVGRLQVARWRGRYVEHGFEGIRHDLPRGAPPAKVTEKKLRKLVMLDPPDASANWTVSKLARALGVSNSTAARHLRANKIKLHPPRQALKSHEDWKINPESCSTNTTTESDALRLLAHAASLEYGGIQINDLEEEIARVRSGLEWRFAHAKEPFDVYMVRVIKLNHWKKLTEGTLPDLIEKFEASLVKRFPVTDEHCPDEKHRKYLVEACSCLALAEAAEKEKRSEIAWHFLAQAEHQLGCADGYHVAVSDPNMKQSRAASGGKKKAENQKEKERTLYIELLDTLELEPGWESKSEAIKKTEAIKKVLSEATTILKTFNISVEDPFGSLYDLLTTDSGVKAAFEKFMRRHGN
ncbi:helix-turn-helix domain-containing protein [Burkholderia sp. L27(2015)]|uniref:helix-turn-helix domain-containing protein n=1 Tax=Burkholderia sp. L27(2015) TaxID=1641858 RepID=UPI00131A68AB|nr:helix-turn-helix domain-containing protein [Burkholderia sp. L27(2015)]